MESINTPQLANGLLFTEFNTDYEYLRPPKSLWKLPKSETHHEIVKINGKSFDDRKIF